MKGEKQMGKGDIAGSYKEIHIPPAVWRTVLRGGAGDAVCNRFFIFGKTDCKRTGRRGRGGL